MSTRTLEALSSLTAVGFPPEARVWADAASFSQDNIRVSFKLGAEYTKSLDKTVDFLRDKDGTAFVFSNSKALSRNILPVVEAKLDKTEVSCDVLHVHGSLKKQEKFGLIQLFAGSISIPSIRPRLSAADVGIDDKQCLMVSLFEWAVNVAAFQQRRGRAGRNGEDSEVVLVAGLTSYIAMRKMILRSGNPTSERGTDNNKTSLMGFPANSRSQSNKKERCPLTRAQMTNNIERQGAEFVDMLSLFCFDCGCILRRLDAYLASGAMPDPTVKFPRCNNACPTCSGDWKEMFRTVWQDGAMAWLEDNSGCFPMKATAANFVRALVEEGWVD